MDPMDTEQFRYYVRGYLDALETVENFQDLPIPVVLARAREWIDQKTTICGELSPQGIGVLDNSLRTSYAANVSGTSCPKSPSQ